MVRDIQKQNHFLETHNSPSNSTKSTVKLPPDLAKCPRARDAKRSVSLS